MSQQNPLELAKQGNPSAIAALINRNLKPKGVTAKVSRKDDCLRVMLEANEVPNQDSLVELIRSGVLKLNVSGINTLQIFGRQADDEVPVWSQIINLKESQLYPISQKQTSESKELESSSTKSSVIPHSTSSSVIKSSSSKSTFKADSGRPRYSSKTSSKQSQLGSRSDQSPKKTDSLLSLLNSSSENNPIVQWIGIIFFLLFALIMWWTLGKGSDPSPRTQSPGNITIPNITAPTTVTFDEYNRLQNGMSYEEVSGIIGEPGQESSRVEVPGTPVTVMYSWQNADGSNMNAMFQDDKLVTKAQFGLK